MDDLSDGLQIYGIIKSGSTLIILCIILSCASYFYYYVINKSYIQAKNSQITYKYFSNEVPLENCDSKQLKPECKFFNEYDDNNNKHYAFPTVISNSHPPPHVGNSNFYYEAKNPQNYIGFIVNPSLATSIIVCIIIIIILFAIMNLYFTINNKSYGSVYGGVEAASDIFSIFNKKHR
jgi:ATP-dependent Zn protease